MKIKKFKVDIYDWDVKLIEVQSAKDFKKLLKELRKFKCSDEDIAIAKANIMKKNGGDHFYQLSRRESLILLYKQDSKRIRNSVLCHEKRHLEDRILQYCFVDDIEAAGYLAGYLGEKLI